ncbi:hypothetical protein PLICRDRAFT_422211 [Plicaturopsis crispa FD-325 SS-3]|nr:hypothetical protein PLICRDRAFT_422211 [Plicaturopsis crispa FD-325 SS-3]
MHVLSAGLMVGLIEVVCRREHALLLRLRREHLREVRGTGPRGERVPRVLLDDLLLVLHCARLRGQRLDGGVPAVLARELELPAALLPVRQQVLHAVVVLPPEDDLLDEPPPLVEECRDEDDQADNADRDDRDTDDLPLDRLAVDAGWGWLCVRRDRHGAAARRGARRRHGRRGRRGRRRRIRERGCGGGPLRRRARWRSFRRLEVRPLLRQQPADCICSASRVCSLRSLGDNLCLRGVGVGFGVGLIASPSQKAAKVAILTRRALHRVALAVSCDGDCVDDE